MPEEIKSNGASAAPDTTEVSTNPSGPVITTERKSTEVLDNNGKTLSSTGSALDKIFEQIESGKPADQAIKDVSAHKEAPSDHKEEAAPVEEPVVIEKKTPAPPPEKATEAVHQDKKEDDVSDDELRILPHDKPKTAKRIEKLLKKITETENRYVTTEKEAKERADKIKALEEEVAKARSIDPKALPEVKQQLDELAMYRRRYNLESDPEVKKRFDDRVVNTEGSIQKLLTDVGTPPALIDIVKSEGGWLKFADSNRKIKLVSGKEMSAAEIAEELRRQLPLSERRRLEAMELDQTQAARDKETYFAEEQKKATEYFTQREQEAKQQTEAQKAAIENATKELSTWRQKFTSENDWLKPKEVPASASAEEKAAIEDHNKHAKQLVSQLDKYMSANDMNSMLEVLVDALKYHQERRNLAFALADKQKLEAALKAKQEELDRFKRSSSAVPRSGSLASPQRPSAETTPKTPPSLERAFDLLSEGKSLDS